MKLGLVPYTPYDWRTMTVEEAQQVRQTGYKGLSIFFDTPLEADDAAVKRLRDVLRAADLEAAQANGRYEALVNPDDALRALGVRALSALCRIGRRLDAHSVYVRPGGLNPNGHWYAHRDNHTQATFDRLVESLRLVSAVAESEGVTLAVEGHVLSVLDTPERVADLLDAVGSPALRFNLDPVNFIGTVRDVHDTSRILNALFDQLGSRTVATHAKDCALRDALVVHIDEVIPGQGTLDYALYLRRFAQVCPDGYVFIEHLPPESVPAARAFVTAEAARLGLPLET